MTHNLCARLEIAEFYRKRGEDVLMIDLDPELHKTLNAAYQGNPPQPSILYPNPYESYTCFQSKFLHVDFDITDNDRSV